MWSVCPSLKEWKWLKDSCSPWDLGGPRNGGLPLLLVTLGLSAAWHLLSWAQTWQVASAGDQWSNRPAGQPGQVESVRGQDGHHQPGGEGVGEEDGELPEERGPCWEDQQAQAPGLMDRSYMKSPPQIISLIASCRKIGLITFLLN